MINKKSILLGISVIVLLISGFGIYRWNTNRPSTKREVVAKKIEAYYESKPRVSDEATIEKSNSKLQKVTEGSFCEKAGYSYQVTNSEGGVVCTPGYH